MKDEIFKPIRGYEGIYEVSNHGRILSCVKSWMGRTKPETVLSTKKQDNGYKRVIFCNNTGIRRSFSVHRLVAEHFIENPKNHPIVNHLNSDPNDNYFENLEWTTYKGNAIHAFANGRRKGRKGTDHPQARYREMDIRIIKKLFSDGKYSQAEIAKMLLTNQASISRIVLGKRWKHIL